MVSGVGLVRVTCRTIQWRPMSEKSRARWSTSRRFASYSQAFATSLAWKGEMPNSVMSAATTVFLRAT